MRSSSHRHVPVTTGLGGAPTRITGCPQRAHQARTTPHHGGARAGDVPRSIRVRPGTKAYDDKDDSDKDSRGRTKRGHLAPFMMLLCRSGLCVVGCLVPDPRAVTDLPDWRRELAVFAVDDFIEADHVRDRSFDIPQDLTIAVCSTVHSASTSAI